MKELGTLTQGESIQTCLGLHVYISKVLILVEDLTHSILSLEGVNDGKGGNVFQVLGSALSPEETQFCESPRWETHVSALRGKQKRFVEILLGLLFVCNISTYEHIEHLCVYVYCTYMYAYTILHSE